MNPHVPPLSESEYWRDFHVIRNDVNAAMVSCYTHRALNDLVAGNRGLSDKVNRVPEFWRVTSFSLQTTLFIVLARILDTGSDFHSVHKLLSATIAHPEFFTKASLRARKLAIHKGAQEPPWLEQYVQEAWEPAVPDLRELKRALAPHTDKFNKLYRPIRHHIAHITHKDPEAIAALYANTLKADHYCPVKLFHSTAKSLLVNRLAGIQGGNDLNRFG